MEASNAIRSFPIMTTGRIRRLLRSFCPVVLAVVTAFGNCETACAQDWPQWRGPLGQGITTAKNLPPAADSSSLKVLWKTPVPGEGCSSPIVSQGRVYLTTAYEGTERHAWDWPAFWATILLACAVVRLAFRQLPGAWRSFAPRPALMAALSVWTTLVVMLTAIVLAEPPWFWQFADPWSGTRVVPAELPWVESLYLRPVIVLVCGSLMLIFAGLEGSVRAGAEVPSAPSLLTQWLHGLTIAVTVTCGLLLGTIGWRPDCFYPASQPWLAWLVTGGLAFYALTGSIGWLEARGRLKLLPIGAGFAIAIWLFFNIPNDEFGHPLSLLNRLAYLVPGILLLSFHARVALARPEPSDASQRVPILFLLTMTLAVLVFVRSNYLLPQTGVVRAVVCLDAETGKVLWNTPIFIAAAEKRHSLNSLATPTPACDGERVYADFGSALAALDTDGRILWLKRDPDFAGFIRYGAGSSVVLADDRILLYRDSEFVGHGDHLDDDIQSQTARRPSALTAYDKATGDVVWRITPPFSHDSYMTPLVWTRDDEREIVVATWKTLAGFALRDGSVRWTYSYPMQQIVPSPAVNGDCLFVTGGNVTPCPMIAVRAPAATTAALTLWSNSKVGGTNIVSPVCWDGLLFSVSHVGVLTCLDTESGIVRWQKRLGSRCLASLSAGDGKIYVLDEEGTLHVFAADATGAELATHSFSEKCSATPALAANSLFVRTAGHVYRVGSE